MSRKGKSAKVFDSVDNVQLDSNLQVTSQCKATCKGIALIVSNNYEGTKSPLPGTDRDSDVMTTFFSTLGNYEVVVPKKNLRVKEFIATCKQLASLEYPEVYKRMVIYFAGHGGDGYIALQDKPVRIDDIQAIFDPGKHQKLHEMVRMFFIDACRGSTRYASDDHTRGGPGKKSYEVCCKYKNEVIAYSTLKGYTAYDDEKSWTQALYECLVPERYQQDDLLRVLIHANNKLGSRQTATCKYTLTEPVYFWIESGFLTDNAVVDVDNNEEASKTALSDIATAQSSLEQLLLQEQPDGSGGGGGNNDASVQQCTEQTGTSPAQTAQPNAITIPVQEQEHGNTTEQLSVPQPEDQVITPTIAGQPVTPTVVGQPVTPTVVGQPVTPTVVGQPVTPTIVGQPVTPTVAGQPVTPTVVGQPVTPTVVGQPVTPTVVGQPVTPTVVGQPVTPTVVGQPVTPTVVGQPVTPTVVGQPVTPTVVGQPVTPTVVGQPVTPTIVGQPVTPTVVGQPVTPTVVGQPVTPTVVGQPVTPTVVGQPVTPTIVGQPVTPTEAVQSDGPTQLTVHAPSTVATNQEQRSKAFIVYQNKGDLCDQVHDFVDFLRFHCSVDCDVVSYYLNKNIINWDKHIEQCIAGAEYILLVCTKELDERLNGQCHNRVEMTRSSGPHILSTTLNSLLVTSKTLPIILEEHSKKYVPTSYKSTTIYTISFGSLPIAANTTKQEAKKILDMPEHKDLRSLVAKLLGQPEVVKPPVASNPPNLTRRPYIL